MAAQKWILVVGGAGYIGSHTVRMLAQSNCNVIVLDNLVYGHKDAIVNDEVVFVEGDLGDREVLDTIWKEYEIEAVMHFAAFAYVGESVSDPAKYYENNVAKPLVLLDAMREHNCNYFIFSSTCATYGKPQYIPIDEEHPQNPINPYGQSKLMLEKILADYDRAYGIKHINLRYFNASGAAEDGLIGEAHDPETHLIPLVLQAAKGERKAITIFGTDWDTPDKTCVRDYIHILDLASAHIRALQYLKDYKRSDSINLGTGKGMSVKEIIETSEKVCGVTIPKEYGERREGDPPELVGDVKKAKEVLGWEARYTSVEEVIASAWAWHNGPRNGKYEK